MGDVASKKDRGSPERCVLFCDRGVPDARAYMDESEFNKVLAQVGTNLGEVFDRYNAVIHLVTAADGARDFYTLSNNKARTETPEEAIEADERTQRAWIGHPHLIIINNDPPGSDIKLKRVL